MSTKSERRDAARGISKDDFRRALGEWASGVTVVTAADGERVHGMTVSAFSSVSLDPPLVLVCADHASMTHSLIERGRCFAVHVLAASQQDLSNHFASKAAHASRFEGIAWRTGATGAPLIPDVAARLDCTLVASHVAGDHTIHVGRVETTEVGDQPPLLFHRGCYGAFAADEG